MIVVTNSFAAEERRMLTAFVLSLFSGAVAGAVSAKFFLFGHSSQYITGFFSGFFEVSFLRRLLISLLFPTLIFVASLFGRSSILAFLLFGKGFLFSFILSICVNCGCFSEHASVYRALFFRNILPLPVFIYSAFVLLNRDDSQRSVSRFRYLFLNHLTAFLCVGMEAAVNAIL